MSESPQPTFFGALPLNHTCRHTGDGLEVQVWRGLTSSSPFQHFNSLASSTVEVLRATPVLAPLACLAASSLWKMSAASVCSLWFVLELVKKCCSCSALPFASDYGLEKKRDSGTGRWLHVSRFRTFIVVLAMTAVVGPAVVIACTTTNEANSDCAAITDANIGLARDHWFHDQAAATSEYGHISSWYVQGSLKASEWASAGRADRASEWASAGRAD